MNWKTTKIFKNDLKVKQPTSKRREKAVNTDFTFQLNTKTQFVSSEDSAIFSGEFSIIELEATVDNESYQPYYPKETSESDYSSDTSQQSDASFENNFLKEPKHLVFWSSLLLLFRYCFTSKKKNKIYVCKNSTNSSCHLNQIPQ